MLVIVGLYISLPVFPSTGLSMNGAESILVRHILFVFPVDMSTKDGGDRAVGGGRGGKGRRGGGGGRMPGG